MGKLGRKIYREQQRKNVKTIRDIYKEKGLKILGVDRNKNLVTEKIKEPIRKE